MGCFQSKVLSTQKGIGIMEIVVSVGLLGLLVAGVATTINYLSRSNVQAQAKVASMALQKDLRTQLQDQAICTTSLTLSSAVNGNTPLPSSVRLTPALVVSQNTPLPTYDNIVVTHLGLENFRLEGTL